MKIPLALCKTYTEQHAKKYDFKFYAEPKIDGLRGWASLFEKKIYSRQGKAFGNNNVDAVLDTLLKIFGPDWYVDGELLSEDWYQTISALHTITKKPEEVKYLVFHVFDAITRKEYKDRKTPTYTSRRKRLVENLYRTNKLIKNVIVVPVAPLESSKSISELLNKAEYKGYEGLVLKYEDSEYPFGRTDQWLKVKSFLSKEFMVLDIQEGEGKYSGSLGALIIEPKPGIKCKVGSGFTDEQRDKIWENPEDFLGRFIEVKFQSEHPSGSLMFPTFLRFRNDK